MAAVLAILAFAPGTASAQLIDPSTLQIGPQLGNTLDPVQIGNTGQVTVSNVSNGAAPLNVPWLVIVGIPNTTSTTAKITSVNGSPASITGTLAGTMIAGQEAYSQVGLDPGTNNSNSFTNWAGREQQINHITATSFGLFEFSIPVTLSGGGTDTFQFSGLPVGAYVIAYGTTSTHVYDTPFTEAGLETGQNFPVPEPSTVALALTGAIGFGLAGLRRLRRQKAVA
jgi:hypothetical protein